MPSGSVEFVKYYFTHCLGLVGSDNALLSVAANRNNLQVVEYLVKHKYTVTMLRLKNWRRSESIIGRREKILR